jgi:hypothetical protein
MTFSPIAEVGAHAFFHCSVLTQFQFSGNLSKIGDYAFASCSKLALEPMHFEEASAIGAHAFEYCVALIGPIRLIEPHFSGRICRGC